MNERIKELAVQAEWRFADNTTGNFSEYDKRLEKFAELIIHECIAVHEADYGLDIIGNELKKHFGVKL